MQPLLSSWARGGATSRFRPEGHGHEAASRFTLHWKQTHFLFAFLLPYVERVEDLQRGGQHIAQHIAQAEAWPQGAGPVSPLECLPACRSQGRQATDNGRKDAHTPDCLNEPAERPSACHGTQHVHNALCNEAAASDTLMWVFGWCVGWSQGGGGGHGFIMF